jgi:hypothetical protein
LLGGGCEQAAESISGFVADGHGFALQSRGQFFDWH